MDAVTDPLIKGIVIKSSAQVGKTEIINNIVGYFVDQDPSPILLLQPTLEMGETWSKDRLAPMLRDTVCLQGKVKDPRSRDGNNTIMRKAFPGGHITIAGANSPASLASRPVRIVMCDEVDRYPVSAGTEGDPVNLAKKRTTTFWNSLFVEVSTPTIKGASRIEQSYEMTDKRRYFVPCKDCKEYQILEWANVQWEKDTPDSACYICSHCGSVWNDADRLKAIEKGEWRGTAPFTGIAGFHINELYSPWVKLRDIVKNFLEAKKSPEKLKTWVNTSLGEEWEEQGEKVDEHTLMKRKENWGNTVPEQAVVVTCGVDVQKDRLEVELVGWGKGMESWSLDYVTIHGDPGQKGVWKELDAILDEHITHATGVRLPVLCTCIDSGGHHTQAVYNYSKRKQPKHVYPCKGLSQPGRPIAGKVSIVGKQRVKLLPVGVDTAKESLFGKLQISEPGAGYCHFPAFYDQEYFEQLTSEKAVTRFKNGIPYRTWIKTRPRNEALDCRVYALAAAVFLGLDRFEPEHWEKMLARYEQPKVMPKVVQQPKQQQTEYKQSSDSWLGDTSGWL